MTLSLEMTLSWCLAVLSCPHKFIYPGLKTCFPEDKIKNICMSFVGILDTLFVTELLKRVGFDNFGIFLFIYFSICPEGVTIYTGNAVQLFLSGVYFFFFFENQKKLS